MGSARTSVWRNSDSDGRRLSAQRPGVTCSVMTPQRLPLCLAIPHPDRLPEYDDAPIVERHVEGSTSHDHAVDESDADTDRIGARDPQQPARRRPVQEERIPPSSMNRRDHDRMAFGRDEGDVADERLVDDGVDRIAVVCASIRQALDGGLVGRHGGNVTPPAFSQRVVRGQASLVGRMGVGQPGQMLQKSLTQLSFTLTAS